MYPKTTVTKKDACQHPVIIIVNGVNPEEESQGGPKSSDLIIRCGACDCELFRMNEKGRRIINLSKHQFF